MRKTLLILFVLTFSSFTFGATFTVTGSDDRNAACAPGNCSLREAVDAANAAPGDDIIEFSTELLGGKIVLSGFEQTSPSSDSEPDF